METLGSWKNAPLAYVAAEVKLGSILNVEPLAAGMQDALAEWFPHLVRGQEFGFILEPNASVRQQVVPRFHFLNMEANACVVLTSDVISLHVTHYMDSVSFDKTFRNVINALSAVRPHQFVERVGLRYWDIVRPEGGMAVPDFFAAPLVELLAPIPGATLTRDVHELLYRLDGPPVHNATVRASVQVPSANAQPLNFMIVPELTLSKPQQAVRAMASNDPQSAVGYLDIDAYAEIKKKIDPAALIESMGKLHKTQSAFFRQLTSERGQVYWKNGEAA